MAVSEPNSSIYPRRIRGRRSPGLLVVLAAAAALLFSACGGSGDNPNSNDADQKPKRGGTFVVALGGDPPTFNLGPSISFLTYQVSANVYSFLIRYDANMRWKPDLATSWEQSKDGRTYTFHLRKGVTWHDGKPFTSADVKFSFEKIHSAYGGNTSTWKAAKITTPDDATVVFSFPKYNALAYYQIGDFQSPIYPEHLWKDAAASETAMTESKYARAPVGTGPFRFDSYQPGQQITLSRNDEYYLEGRPYLDKVVFRVLPSADSRLSALEAGEINFMPRDIPLNQIDRLEQGEGLDVDTQPQNAVGLYYTTMVNVRKPPLSDPAVRQAISYAINRDQIVSSALFGNGSVNYNPLLNSESTTAAPILSPDLPTYEHDPDKAKELLDQAGYAAGSGGTRFKLRLLVESSLPANRSMADLIQNDLKQVGIQVDLQTVDTPTAQSLFYLKWDFDLYLVRLVTFNGAVLQQERRVTSPYIQKAISLNGTGYSNPKVDALYKQAIDEPDGAKRKRLLVQIQNQVATDLPMISVANEPVVRAFTTNFAGIPPLTIGDETYEGVWQRSG